MQSITVVHRERLPSILQERLPARVLQALRECPMESIEEIRMHAERCMSVSCGEKNHLFDSVILRPGEPEEILCELCKGSRYAYHDCINQGYLPLEQGLRVGVVGSAALQGGRVIGVSEVSGLILRIPHPLRPDVSPLLPHLSPDKGGMLLYAPPGAGKTTVLRSLAIALSGGSQPQRTVVVDAREELVGTLPGRRLLLDVLVGYPKQIGIAIAIRSLGAQVILCDEIGGAEDARALLHSANCGVPIVATAHAADERELLCRPHLRHLVEHGVFSTLVGIRRTRGGTSFVCRSIDRLSPLTFAKE